VAENDSQVRRVTATYLEVDSFKYPIRSCSLEVSR